jgi:hypothetical protein
MNFYLQDKPNVDTGSNPEISQVKQLHSIFLEQFSWLTSAHHTGLNGFESHHAREKVQHMKRFFKTLESLFCSSYEFLPCVCPFPVAKK